MRWRPRAAPTRAKERANISFFIFIMFFAVFGVIILTELLLLERPPVNSARSRYSDALQVSRETISKIEKERKSVLVPKKCDVSR
ncbi:hypothetical protein MSG28_004089 [Choristoneura fumiferana]|uniref:Uncharacterized protein n=1 Tax=Choristoneura fumiferana TaxID=7141 RepID=A0ACC0KH78_CHOFU|nr:hypothetical protein MSG28_004089 [Choristoneura fumiferana]